MKIGERLRRGAAPCFSFEFFPPKTDDGQANLFTALEELAGLDPAFVSVTYGAGGSGCDRTLDVVRRIRRETGLEAMAHVTCLGHTRAEMHSILQHLETAGIENLLALRGDTPKNTAGSPHSADDFRFAVDFVRFVRGSRHSFSVGGACYPEGHIECPSRQIDLHRLRNKVDAGLDFLITQLFFDNAFYFDFVSRARKAGVKVPIIPGIMPITNIEQLAHFTRMCGATIPMRLALELERMQDEPEAVVELGVAHATVQCMDLLARGAPGVHFFTLNRSAATRMILTALRWWRRADRPRSLNPGAHSAR